MRGNFQQTADDRYDINRLREIIDCLSLNFSRSVDHQGSANRRFKRRTGVRGKAILIEGFALITRQDQYRFVSQLMGFQIRDQFTDLLIDIMQRIVIGIPHHRNFVFRVRN